MLTSRMITPAVAKELMYPCLLQYERGNTVFVVLASMKNNKNKDYFLGTIVHIESLQPNSLHTIGDFSREWEFENFKPYTGDIVLSSKG